MDKKGEWSSVVWIGDSVCTLQPKYNDAEINEYKTHNVKIQSILRSGSGSTYGELTLYNENSETAIYKSVPWCIAARYSDPENNRYYWRIYDMKGNPIGGKNVIRVTE